MEKLLAILFLLSLGCSEPLITPDNETDFWVIGETLYSGDTTIYIDYRPGEIIRTMKIMDGHIIDWNYKPYKP